MDVRRHALAPSSVPVSSLEPGPAVVAGTVRRLTFVPDGDEGVLLAELDDGTGVLEVRLPRRQAADWAPGARVVAEGAMVAGEFAVRAYLSEPYEGAGGAWIEVAPLSSASR